MYSVGFVPSVAGAPNPPPPSPLPIQSTEQNATKRCVLYRCVGARVKRIRHCLQLRDSLDSFPESGSMVSSVEPWTINKKHEKKNPLTCDSLLRRPTTMVCFLKLISLMVSVCWVNLNGRLTTEGGGFFCLLILFGHQPTST